MLQESLQLSRHPMCTQIEAICEEYVGVRWLPGAHNRHGVDCIGLVIAVAQELQLYREGEIIVPKYNQIPSGNLMLETMSKFLRRVAQPMLGSIVTFAQKGTSLYHVGIIGEKHFYHAALEHGKVVKTSITENALKGRRACFVFEKVDK